MKSRGRRDGGDGERGDGGSGMGARATRRCPTPRVRARGKSRRRSGARPKPRTSRSNGKAGGGRSSAEIVCFRASDSDPTHQRYCDDALMSRWREQPVPHELRGERVSEERAVPGRRPRRTTGCDAERGDVAAAEALRGVWMQLFDRYGTCATRRSRQCADTCTAAGLCTLPAVFARTLRIAGRLARVVAHAPRH